MSGGFAQSSLLVGLKFKISLKLTKKSLDSNLFLGALNQDDIFKVVTYTEQWPPPSSCGCQHDKHRFRCPEDTPMIESILAVSSGSEGYSNSCKVESLYLPWVYPQVWVVREGLSFIPSGPPYLRKVLSPQMWWRNIWQPNLSISVSERTCDPMRNTLRGDAHALVHLFPWIQDSVDHKLSGLWWERVLKGIGWTFNSEVVPLFLRRLTGSLCAKIIAWRKEYGFHTRCFEERKKATGVAVVCPSDDQLAPLVPLLLQQFNPILPSLLVSKW